jgi:hypothetical protein
LIPQQAEGYSRMLIEYHQWPNVAKGTCGVLFVTVVVRVAAVSLVTVALFRLAPLLASSPPDQFLYVFGHFLPPPSSEDVGRSL